MYKNKYIYKYIVYRFMFISIMKQTKKNDCIFIICLYNIR